MVRVKNNLFTRLQGKVDDVVFFTRWGRLYARKAAVKTARPQTPLQQLQRNRMSDAVTFYGIIRTTFLAAGWREAAREKPYSCMNLFIQRNIGGFDGNGQVTDYSRLHFTAGPLPVCDAPEAVYDAGEGVVWLSWQNRPPLGRARLEPPPRGGVVHGRPAGGGRGERRGGICGLCASAIAVPARGRYRRSAPGRPGKSAPLGVCGLRR